MSGMMNYGTNVCKGKDDFLRPDHLISKEDKMMIASLREFVDKEVLPHETEIDDYWDWTEREEPTFVDDLKKKLYVDIGLQAALIPEQYGGMGLTSIVGANLAAEELARGDLGLATEVQMNHWGVTPIIPPTQNDTLLKEFAPKLCGKEAFQ